MRRVLLSVLVAFAATAAIIFLGFIWGAMTNLFEVGHSFWSTATPTVTAMPTATAKAVATATTTAMPTATAKAVAAAKPASKPKPQQVQPTAVPVAPTAVPPTAVPAAPTTLVGDEGPCKGGSTNTHFLETKEGVGNSAWLEYDIKLAQGEVALAWGSQIPGFGDGRAFITIAGPWAGKVGILNGAVRQGRVLTDLAQVQRFWGDVIDCDLQRSVPLKEQKRGLYTQFKLNW